jgi:Ca2+-binding RTX toxin-like protein
LSNTAVHYFNSTVTDVAGNVGPSSGDAIYGGAGNSTLVSTSGNDIMTGGGGGSSSDTFLFNGSSFGKDVITDFQPQGAHHDVIQFSSTTAFNSFAAVLAHAAQVGGSTVITLGTDSVTLSNVSLSKLTSNDFHFV